MSLHRRIKNFVDLDGTPIIVIKLLKLTGDYRSQFNKKKQLFFHTNVWSFYNMIGGVKISIVIKFSKKVSSQIRFYKTGTYIMVVK